MESEVTEARLARDETPSMEWKVHGRGGKLRVVVTKELPGERWLSILAAAGCEVAVSASREVLSAAEIRSAIGERCHGAIGQLTEPWGAELFEPLARAGGRAYSNYAVGYDNVAVAEATRRGIAVGNTPGVLTETTAEMAVALLFAAARRVVEADNFLRQGKFHGWLPDLFLGKRLWGGVLGLVGAGRIGATFARMVAPGHAMDVLYHDLKPQPELETHFAELSALRKAAGERPLLCRRAASVEEVLEKADVVSLHVLLDSSTRHLMNGERLSRMKPDAILINTSRGPVIDEAALVAHLRRNPEFRAGLDVFEREPELAPGLRDLPNAVVVPHIASATRWTREGMASLAAANVAGVLLGYPVVRDLAVEEFLSGPILRKTPSIVNRSELKLPVG
jgi:hydroxypyruvate reductase 1